jgi:hypothetical protein
MGSMADPGRPRRRDDVLAQTAGETVILLTPDSGEYFTLNDVGGRIWELADGTRTVTEIVAALVQEFDAAEVEIRADTEALLAELMEAKLVRGGR